MQNLFLPQRGVKSALYLPPAHELPPRGETAIVGFDFGGQVGAALTAEQTEKLQRDFLLTHIMGVTDALGGSFFLHLLHQHGTVQRELMGKPMRIRLVAGKSGTPFILRSPYLMAAGDSLTAAVSNTGNDNVQDYNYVAANIHVACWGVYL